jgi:hypothetical protein
MQVAPPSSSRSCANGSTSSFSRVVPVPPPGGKPDYFVLSATRKPAGHLSTGGSDGAQTPEALHDTQLLEAVSTELPGCPVLHSLLYSHRNVANDGPSPDEALADVDESVARWREAERAKAMATLNRTLLVQLKEEQVEHTKDLARRSEDHERTITRIDRITNIIEQRFGHSVAETTAILARTGDLTMIENRDKWDLLQAKHEREQEQLLKTLEVISDDQEARRNHEAALDRVTVSAKLQVSEKLQHCLLLSEEEKDRLRITFLCADDKNRVLLCDDETVDRAPIVASERRAFETLRLSYVDTTTRALRFWRSQEMLRGLQGHTQASEHGLRFNVDLEEERSRQDMLATFTTTASVVALVDNVVMAASERSSENDRRDGAATPPP